MIIESQLLVECQAQEINPDKHNNDPDDFIEYITANPCRILDFFTKRSFHRADSAICIRTMKSIGPFPNNTCILRDFVGLEMARHSLKTDSVLITGIIGILALVTSMTLAFISGMIIAYQLVWIGKKRMEKNSIEI